MAFQFGNTLSEAAVCSNAWQPSADCALFVKLSLFWERKSIGLILYILSSLGIEPFLPGNKKASSHPTMQWCMVVFSAMHWSKWSSLFFTDPQHNMTISRGVDGDAEQDLWPSDYLDRYRDFSFSEFTLLCFGSRNAIWNFHLDTFSSSMKIMLQLLNNLSFDSPSAITSSPYPKNPSWRALVTKCSHIISVDGSALRPSTPLRICCSQHLMVLQYQALSSRLSS